MKSKSSTIKLLIEILERKKKEFERSREKIEEQTVRSFLTNQIDLIDRSLKLTDLWEWFIIYESLWEQKLIENQF